MQVNNPDTSLRRQQEYQLVVQARDTNDQRAFASLLQSYWEPTHLLLLRLTHNNTVAEDLTMESFGKAFSSLKTYVPDYTFGTWLFRIATNTGLDYIRRKRLENTSLEDIAKPGSPEGNDYPLPSDDDNPEEAIIHKQRLALLRQAMTQLDPMYRDLVELRYFEERSYEEIADILKLPLGTVKIRLHRAKNFLRTLISAME